MPDEAARAQAQLVEDLVRDGRVRSAGVRAAFEAVPRHLFLPGRPVPVAYADEPVVIKSADGVTVSTISQPSMVAIMLEQLAAAPGHRVLEIGAGAGWNAGLLGHLVGPDGGVTTVDIDDDLVAGARSNLDVAGFAGVRTVTADGAGGHPGGAPYDRIQLTVGSTDVRPEWVDQMAPDGRLLLPLAVRGSQLSIALDRTGPDRLDGVSVRSCSFVRLRGAGSDESGVVALDTPGWSVQAAERDGPDPARLGRTLAAPADDVVAAPVAGTPADVWDGLGLWCALADTAVFRLIAADDAIDTPLGRSLFGCASGRVTVGLADDDGVALLLEDPPGAIRPFGDGHGGNRAAARLAGHIADWDASGRPHAADLGVTVLLRRAGDPTVEQEVLRVDTPCAHLLLRWPETARYATGSSSTSGISRSVRRW